ncbi:MAG: tetratricopeptide repeat protein [Bacteroidaceae bacterium]|nr:tetratricopeptide repeat protein [Bacteroidaceae bacterium]
MLRMRYIYLLLLLLPVTTMTAQKSYREHLRSGNRIYSDSIYDKSEVEYRKAIEKDGKDADAHFNLGNALLFQNKAEEALKEYELAAMYETDKERLAQVYHNTGVLMQAAKDYKNAVEAYKQSLRNNPNDHETRYNLALAMSQLKKEEQQNQDQQQDKQDEQQQQEQQQQNQDQQQQKDRQQQQKDQQQQQQNQQQQMSKENAEQLLEAAMQDEKETQERVKKLLQLKGKKLEKDW